MIAIMLGRLRMDVDTAIKHYVDLAEYVFSDMKQWGDGRFKTRKLEEAIKTLVNDVTSDPIQNHPFWTMAKLGSVERESIIFREGYWTLGLLDSSVP
jgi:hypothetical protein